MESLVALTLITIFGSGLLSAADGLIAYDGFAYPSGGGLVNNAGGSGWAGAWTDGFNGVAAESLKSKLGETPAVTGGRMLCASPDWASVRKLTTPIGDKSGTWYVSFLVANEADSTQEHYIRFEVGGDKGFGFGKAWMSGTWALLSPKEIGSTVGCATKDPVFVVLKAIYAADKGVSKIQAFFDPDLATEPKIADIEAAGLDLGVGDSVRLVGKKAASFDEVRIGTTWASVCPTK